jgi:hypothetical protein
MPRASPGAIATDDTPVDVVLLLVDLGHRLITSCPCLREVGLDRRNRFRWSIETTSHPEPVAGTGRPTGSEPVLTGSRNRLYDIQAVSLKRQCLVNAGDNDPEQGPPRTGLGDTP